MTVYGTKISMVRGDTESITINMTEDSVPKSFVTGDIVYFTVKEHARDTAKILQKIITAFTDGAAVIPITHADTKDLEIGNYVYDIQSTFANGTVTTLVSMSQFVLTAEVTYD